jgi:hypothetical protein
MKDLTLQSGEPVLLGVRLLDTNGNHHEHLGVFTALIDTGACRTVVPLDVAEVIGTPCGTDTACAFDGSEIQAEAYYLTVEHPNLGSTMVRALALRNRTRILIGRDLLEEAPAKTLAIDWHSKRWTVGLSCLLSRVVRFCFGKAIRRP